MRRDATSHQIGRKKITLLHLSPDNNVGIVKSDK